MVIKVIEELMTFISVVENNNFTKASKERNLSQPTVSTHIKNLEVYFNTRLIKRSHKQKNIEITKPGELLYERAKKIISILDNTKEEISENGTNFKGTLKIGASLTIGEYFLPEFLGKFYGEFPDIDIEVIIGNTDNICEKVKRMELDLGVVEGIVHSSMVDYDYFHEDEMVIAFSKNDILNEKLELDNLQNRIWITREIGSGTREYLDLFLLDNNITPKKFITLGSNQAIEKSVINNMGITYISYLVVEDEYKNGKINIGRLKKRQFRKYSIITPKEIENNKYAKVFINNLKNYSKEVRK